MTLEEALLLLETILEQKPLSPLEEQVFQLAWEEKSYQKISQDCGYTPDYIRNIGSALWKRLSEVLGEKVTKQNFKLVLKRYLRHQPTSPNILTDSSPFFSGKREKYEPKTAANLTDPASHKKGFSHQDWGEAIAVSMFYDRQEERNLLKQWILGDRCQVVTLLGMGGIGKTALSVKLAQEIADQFDFVFWRCLCHAPTLKDILAQLIKFLSNQSDITLPDSTSEQISRLIFYLQRHRCLVVLDNFETLFKREELVGCYRPGYENYGELLKRLGEAEHQSCLLLTSREEPEIIAALEGELLPVRTLQIQGLAETAGEKILMTKGLTAGGNDAQKLIQRYQGNPLALKIAATSIKDLFGGDIGAFLEINKITFNGICQLLDGQFNRLSPAEKQVLNWLAINQEPRTAPQLEKDIYPPISMGELLEILESLRRRSLIELTASGFTLQPVVLEYTIEKLIGIVYQEIADDNSYPNPSQNSDNLIELNSAETCSLFPTLQRYALTKATAKDHIRQSQIRVILEPLIRRLHRIYGNAEQITIRIYGILNQLQRRGFCPGYAAGNLINILCYLKADLTARDFSNLAIWQADLTNVELHRVNFARSDVSSCLFAQTLGSILSVKFSPDGEKLAVSDNQGRVQIWRVKDCRKLLDLNDHQGWVWSVAFSPDGNKLASCSTDRMIKIWDANTGICQKTLQDNSSINSVIFSRRGNRLVSGTMEGKIAVWDVNTGECLNTFSTETQLLWSVALHPENKLLASSCDDETVKLWDVETGECLQILRGHGAMVWSVIFNPLGDKLASSSHDGTVKIWDTKTGECLQTLRGHKNPVHAVAFDALGETIAGGSIDGTARIWNLKTGECLQTLQGHSQRVWSVAFHPQKPLLATGGDDKILKFWNTNTGENLRTLQGSTDAIWSISFDQISGDQTSENERVYGLAGGGDNSMIRLWSFPHGENIKTLVGHSCRVLAVVINPQFKQVISGSEDCTIKVWDIHTGTCLNSWTLHPHYTRSMALNSSGKIAATGNTDHTVKLWNLNTGECLATLSGHTNWVMGLRFFHGDQKIVSAGFDGTVKVWNLNTYECDRTFFDSPGLIFGMALSPDENWVATAGEDGKVRVWDFNTGNCLKVFSAGNEAIHGVVFHPQKPILAAGLNSGNILLWDLQTDQCFATLKEHRDFIRSLVFTPDGETLITGSLDGTIKFWDISTKNSYKTLIPPRRYQGMNIAGIQGLNSAGIATLKQLGAVCEESDLSEKILREAKNPPPNGLLQQSDRPLYTLGKNHH